MIASKYHNHANRTAVKVLAIGTCVYVIARVIFYLISDGYSSTMVDEAAAVFLFPFVPIGLFLMIGRRSGLAVAVLISVYAIAIVLSSVIGTYSLERGYGPFWNGVFLETKPFAILFGLYYLVHQENRKGNLQPAIRALCMTLLVIAIIDIPFVLHDLIGGSDIFGARLGRRSGFFRPNGLFRHPVANAQQLLCALIAALTLLRMRFSIWLAATAALISFCIAISFQVKETAAALLVVTTYPFLARRISAGTIVLAFLGLLAAVSLVLIVPADNPITEHFNASLGESEETVRASMHKASLQIASDNFPLGSGISTFGSEGSRRGGYSSLYKAYDVWGLWGATYSNDRYLLDTFWPKVLSEAGVFGLIGYLGFVLLGFLIAFARLQRERTPIAYFSFLVISVALLLSTGMQAFNEELIGPLFFLALACTIVPGGSPVRRSRKRPLGAAGVVEPVHLP